MKIAAVIFDWGNVLAENPFPAMLGYFAKLFGVSGNALAELYRDYDEAFTTGRLAEQDLWNQVALRLQLPSVPRDGLWETAIGNVYRPFPEMWDLVARLRRSGYRTALLSNTEAGGARFFLKQGYGPLFDAVLLSCREGVRKPDPRFFQLALDRLGLPAAQCAFTDDRADFVAAAAALGLHGICFRGREALLRELAELGLDLEVEASGP